MTSQLQIIFINSITSSTLGILEIDHSKYPELNINTLKKQIRQIIELDISILIHDTHIINIDTDLRQFIKQEDNINKIIINVIYDSIKKSERLKRINDGFKYFVRETRIFMYNQHAFLGTLDDEELDEYINKLRLNTESLMLEFDKTNFRPSIYCYLRKPKKRINMKLYNLESILTIPYNDIERKYIMLHDDA